MKQELAWSDRETDLLRYLAARGFTAAEVVEVFRLAGLPPRSKAKVCQVATALNVSIAATSLHMTLGGGLREDGR